MIKNILYIICINFLIINVYAQSTVIKSEVEREFANFSSITKKIELYGYKNGSNEIQLYLANNDDEWKGICYLPSSDTKYRLEGGFVDKKLILNELTSKGQIMGMWKIDLKKKPIKAKWQNIARTKSFSINLKELNNLNKSIEILNNNVSIYNTKILNQNHQLIVTQNNKGINKVSIINLKNYIFLKNHTHCLSEDCNTFEISFDIGQKLNKLICKKNDNGLDIKIWDNKRTKFTEKAKLEKDLKLQNNSFINKYYCLNIEYPELSNKQFNASIKNAINSIVDSLKSEMRHLTKSKYDIENRLTLEAKGWFDIDYYSDYAFSGRLIIQRSYSKTTQVIPINFSLKSGKKINIFKEFKQDFNLDFYTKQYLKENIKNLPAYKISLSRNLLKPTNFKYLTLSKAGIVLSTDFNSIFGSYKIILPYSEIINDIRRRSILKKIIKA